MASPTDKCVFCGHPRKDHCKGGVFHANYKDVMRMVPKAKGHYCAATHCTSVLCCCLVFQETPNEL